MNSLGTGAGVDEGEDMQQRCNVTGEEELLSGGGTAKVRRAVEVNPVGSLGRVHACSQKARFLVERDLMDRRAVFLGSSAVQRSAAE